MKIQVVNSNQNNISYKAYFKPNTCFEELYKNADKTTKLTTSAKKFRGLLPHHEIEISQIKKANEGRLLCDLVNNVTKEKMDVLTTIPRISLNYLIDYLCFSKDSSFFKGNDKKEEPSCYDILTKEKLD